MQAFHTTRSARLRSGYTLIEIMLVVTIIMVIAAMASAPLITSWRDVRLGEEAERVRVLAAGTRMEALDSDQVWQFRFEPGGTRYVRVPVAESEDDSGSAAATSSRNGKRSGRLPEGMRFSPNLPAGGGLSENLLAGLPDAGELGQVSWSSPVEFFPDGTSTHSTFEVLSDLGGSRQIQVRSVTGAVTVMRPGRTPH